VLKLDFSILSKTASMTPAADELSLFFFLPFFFVSSLILLLETGI